MKSRLILISAVVATTFGVSGHALSSDKRSEHPAVIVAKTWNARGIDPNTFIVAHPARLQLIEAPASESRAPRVAEVK